jgi:hypothetical protein
MTHVSRQRFLSQAAAGAAVAGALAASPAISLARAAARPRPVGDRAGIQEPLIAHVRDAARGEISIMQGTHEVVLHDPDLVRRLLAAAH